LQPIRVRGHRQQAPGLTLLERSKPQLGQVKCPEWRRINAERWRIFEGPKKPVIAEEERVLAKKRAELVRVLERLADPDLRPGIARELRKHVTILEREIAELESA